jgi:hypothetical protein
MDESLQDYEIFDLGDVTLQHGATLRDAKLAYKTYGALNADKTNAIVYPTWYSGRHWDNEWLIGGTWPWIRPSTSSSSRTSWAMGSRLRRRTHRPLRRRASRTSPSTIRRATTQDRHVIRDRDPSPRDRLVDGRRADPPVGRQLSGHGSAGLAISAARPIRASTTSCSSRVSSRR